MPLKVTCFVWLVLRDRIVARDRFHMLGMILEEGNVCLFCEDGIEVSSHLFVHCARVHRLWDMAAQFWGMNFVGARNVVATFEIRSHAFPRGPKFLIWKMAFVVLLWAI